MSVVHYRLMFDRNPEREPINDADEFRKLLAEHLADLNPCFAGYIIPDAKRRRYERGDPLWQALVYPTEGMYVFSLLADRKWTVDGYSILLQYKTSQYPQEETFFPLWDRVNTTTAHVNGTPNS